MRLKEVFLRMMVFFLCVTAPNGATAAGYLMDEEADLLLAKMGSSKEAVLRAFLATYDVPEATAAVITEHCLNPHDAKARAWAKGHSGESSKLRFEGIAAAYVEGQNQDPPSASRKVYRARGDYELLFCQPTLSRFCAELDLILDATYPIVHFEQPQQGLIECGLRGTLTKEETLLLQGVAYDALAASETPSATAGVPVGYYLACAYVNQTGDRDFLRRLWDSTNGRNKTTCLLTAVLSKTPLVQVAVELLETVEWEDLERRSENRNISGFGRWIFLKHKTVYGVGDLLRKWAQHPDKELFQRRQLYCIMKEPGWSPNEDMFNRFVLQDYYMREQPIVDSAREALEAIDKRLKGP